MDIIYKKILLICVLILVFICLMATQNSNDGINFKEMKYTLQNTLQEKKLMNNIHNNIETFTNNQTPTVFDKIDKVYFINLKHREDRLKQINNEFNKVGIPKDKIERIDAVNSKYNGHIGCCKSHIKTMKEIIKNKHKHTLVFEDDFVFRANRDEFNTKMNKFLDEQKEDWDIVQLASVYVKTDDSDKDYKKVQRASTSSAYLINKGFVPKLLENLEESLSLMEKDMRKFNQRNNGELKKKFETPYALDQNWYPLQRKSRWYLFKPYLGKQGGEASKSSILNRKLEGFAGRYKVKHFKLRI